MGREAFVIGGWYDEGFRKMGILEAAFILVGYALTVVTRTNGGPT